MSLGRMIEIYFNVTSDKKSVINSFICRHRPAKKIEKNKNIVRFHMSGIIESLYFSSLCIGTSYVFISSIPSRWKVTSFLSINRKLWLAKIILYIHILHERNYREKGSYKLTYCCTEKSSPRIKRLTCFPSTYSPPPTLLLSESFDHQF